MIPSVTVVLDYHVLWTYEVLYCKKKKILFKLTRPSKRVSFVSHTSYAIFYSFSFLLYIYYIYITVYRSLVCVSVHKPYGTYPLSDTSELRALEVCILTVLIDEIIADRPGVSSVLAFSRITIIVACYSKRSLLAYDDDILQGVSNNRAKT